MSAAKYEEWLTSWLAQELGRDPAALEPERPFSELGVSSLQATSLIGELEHELGTTFPATLPWDYPSIRALAAHLAGLRAEQEVHSVRSPTGPNELDRLRADLARLGVEIGAAEGKLTVKAPVGALTPELRERIAAHRDALLARLSGPRNMSLSLFFFTSDDSTPAQEKYRLVLEGAKFADAHGFEAVWTPERHFHAMGGPFPNPSLMAVAVAGATSRIGVRAGSVVLPLHDPIRVAEEWAVVDHLSKGRAGLSLASGWHADDFALAPDNYEDRKRILLDRLDVLRKLLRGETIQRTSGSGAPVEVRTYPRPLQHAIPIWLTAIGNPETFKVAGRAGAHLLTCLLGQTPADLAAKIASYREARREAGHDPNAGRVTVMVHAFVGETDASVRDVVHDPFVRYLRTTLDLLGNLASSLGVSLDPRKLAAAEESALVEFAFERYLSDGALFGSPETCIAKARSLAKLGVSEIACLVDFGLPMPTVMEGLTRLASLPHRDPSAFEVAQ